MSFDLISLQNAVAQHGTVARVVVVKTAGSVPREAGTAMLVWQGGQSGTIGGGALEFEAVKRARKLSSGKHLLETIPLGPGVGQCCGGSVTLVTETYDANTLPKDGPVARRVGPSQGPCPEPTGDLVFKNGWLIEPISQPKRNIWIYGAGHVGRALVNTLAPLPDLELVWVDTAQDRFPTRVPDGVDCLVATDPATAARHAPPEAEHLILTYSHELDLALCHTLISQPTGSIGLIGSETKWVKFQRRLTQLGHSMTEIAKITCPIGDPSLGKHPQEIAIGVAMGMLVQGMTTGQHDQDDQHAAQA